MRLYDISNTYRLIEADIEASGGELTPEIEAQLNRADVDLAAKIDAIGVVITEAEVDAEALSQQAERFKKRASVAKNKADHLRDYVQKCLALAGKDSAKGALFSATIQEASLPKIRWTSDAPIPRAFVKIAESVDGRKAHDAQKAGTLPAGFAVERSKFLVLR